MKHYEHPKGQPAGDILDSRGMGGSKAAAVDLYGETMIDSFTEFRRLVDDPESGYTMNVNPSDKSLMIKDQEGKVVFLHEAGTRLEAAYQDWKKEHDQRAKNEEDSAAKTNEVGN